MSTLPKITFGIIVLNGEPFTRYCLRQIYPWAHEIIVVEGACPGAAAVATEDGHSSDGTLEALERFKEEGDPDGKLTIVTREGFWSEKDEMSQAYAERATGDWLWQVDVDEFYRDEEVEGLLRYLGEHPETTAVSFEQIGFWGSPRVRCDSLYLLLHNMREYHRLFRWGPEYTYVTHRPPTVTDAAGQDLREQHWLDARQSKKQGIRLYHASLLLPKQVREKCAYYANADWARRTGAEEWAERCYFGLEQPFRVHNVYQHRSWLEAYDGPLPAQLEALWEDLQTGKLETDPRPMEDVEQLLQSPRYRAQRGFLKMYVRLMTPIFMLLNRLQDKHKVIRVLIHPSSLRHSSKLRSLLAKIGLGRMEK